MCSHCQWYGGKFLPLPKAMLVPLSDSTGDCGFKGIHNAYAAVFALSQYSSIQ